MKSQKIILIVLFGIIAMSSCKYECSCFDKSLLVWMPQDYGDKIQFTNQDNLDTLTFVVTKKSYTDSYKIERQNKQSCFPSAYLIADNFEDTLNYNLTIETDYKNILTQFFGSIYLGNKKGTFGINDPNLKELVKSKTINNKNYNIITFENDTITNNNEIYKIILAENYGLLKFYEKSGKVWTLIEK